MKKKILDIINKKNKSKIVSLAAYSKNIASIIDNFCDIILVGDSLGSVLYNYKSTREVTLNAMIEHSKSVRMGIKKSLMVVDMPHNTYRNSKEALKNAKKIMLKTKCDQAMATELQNKIKQYDAESSTKTDEENGKRLQEVQSMEQSIRQYQAQAQQDLQKKELDLLKPITEKAKNAILKVGNTQGFDYILDSSQGQGVIMANGKDLLADVKSELGF